MPTLQVKSQNSRFIYKIFNHVSYFDFIYKQPMLLMRLLKNYFLILVFKKKLLRITDIAVTYACNATCEHCCTDTNVDSRKKPLSAEELQSCIKQSVGMGSMIFNFLGGEPLVCKHIYDTIKFVKANHAIAGMSTNGYLLSKEVVGKLKNAGLDVIQVDLGGGIDPHEIDEIRKLSGCYERAITGISLLKQAGIKVVLSTILTKTLTS